MTLTTITPLAAAGGWLYVAACLLLPLAWGVLTELVFRALARRHRRRSRHADGEDHFLFDYQI
jgi:hypothetical protein